MFIDEQKLDLIQPSSNGNLHFHRKYPTIKIVKLANNLDSASKQKKYEREFNYWTYRDRDLSLQSRKS